ncbi:hypothetical protein a10_07883 [Streptomyces acidiscabies]|nr:hypothetical protein a10_07883 [Streptomyces acidiscabies]GAV44509.1 hypothetical protein Saa2_07479 [Streptomyces acidiscabies]
MTQVKDDRSGGSTVYVVTAEESARVCPLRGLRHPVEGLPHHPAPAPALWWAPGEYPVAQSALVLHRTRLPTRLVHRGDPCGPRGNADHHRPAPGGGGRGLRRLSHRRAGRPRPAPEPARSCSTASRSMRPKPCRPPRRSGSTRPGGAAGAEAEPRHQRVGTRRGRLAHRLRRRDRRTRSVRPGRRPHAASVADWLTSRPATCASGSAIVQLAQRHFADVSPGDSTAAGPARPTPRQGAPGRAFYFLLQPLEG